MTTRLVLVGVVTCLALMIAIFGLVRTRRLQERFALLWIGTAVGVVVFGLWGDALRWLADVFGIAYPPSALFLLASVFVFSVLLHTAVVLSRLSQENQTLAQRLALLDERLRRIEAASGVTPDTEAGGRGRPGPLQRAPRPLRQPTSLLRRRARRD